MTRNQLNIGDKVQYRPHINCDKSLIENGVVKGFPSKSVDRFEELVFVVYNCNGDWNNYHNYTGVSTHVNHLYKGWKK